MQLWFNTGIAGITKEAVTDVKWTQVKNFEPSAKKQIVSEIKTKQMEKLWRISPKTSVDDVIVWFSIDKISWLKDNQSIIDEYSNKMPIETLDTTNKLINDISWWYNINQIKKAYPDVNPEVVEDVYDVYHSKYNDSSAIESFAWGVVWKIPKIIWNLIKVSIDNPMISPTWFIDKIKEATWKKSIWWQVKTEVENVTKEFAQDINRQIWGNEEDMSYKMWEFLVEIAPFFIAPEIGAEKAVSEIWTSKLASKFPWVAKFLNNQFIKNVLQKSLESTVTTPASVAISEWRTATPTEMGIWAITQNILWSKNLKKSKRLKNVLSETDTKANMLEWLREWTLKNLPSKAEEMFLWVWNRLNPSKRTQNTLNYIKDNIKNFSTRPTKLYQQLNTKVQEVAKWLWEKLKQINVWWMTSMKKQLMDKIDIVVSEAKNYSDPTKKAMLWILDDIKSAKTMDDIRTSAKNMDRVIPKSIKEWAWKWWKDELIYLRWRDVRNTFNDLMEDYAYNLPDWDVKKALWDMSTLYHWIWQIEENIMWLYKKKWWIVQAAKNLWTVALQRAALNQIFWQTKTDKTEL